MITGRAARRARKLLSRLTKWSVAPASARKLKSRSGARLVLSSVWLHKRRKSGGNGSYHQCAIHDRLMIRKHAASATAAPVIQRGIGSGTTPFARAKPQVAPITNRNCQASGLKYQA